MLVLVLERVLVLVLVLELVLERVLVLELVLELELERVLVLVLELVLELELVLDLVLELVLELVLRYKKDKRHVTTRQIKMFSPGIVHYSFITSHSKLL